MLPRWALSSPSYCSWRGFPGSDYDVSRLTDAVEDYIILQPQTVRECLEQLAAAYFFDVVESDGILKFVPRGGETIQSVPEDDLILEIKEDIRQILDITQAQELELPQRDDESRCGGRGYQHL